MLIAALAVHAVAFGNDPYRDGIAKFRVEREAELKAEDGWLSVPGLFWFKEGEKRFGADPANEIVLPVGSAPTRAGVFELHDGLQSGDQSAVRLHSVCDLPLSPGQNRLKIAVEAGELNYSSPRHGESPDG